MPELIPPQQPTFYFVGVTTGQSASRRIFPAWMQTLGRHDVAWVGLDFPMHDDPANYRACVEFIKREPLALGALVTTHKIDLFEASRDLFDGLDSYAERLGEVSCLAKRQGKLLGIVTDPTSGGQSLDMLTGEGYFGRTGASVLCFGAGGAAAALALHLLSKPNAAEHPREYIVVNRSQPRLDRMAAIVAPLQASTQTRFTWVCNADPQRNDELLASLPPGSVVINATGMGKDSPGSPITEAGVFPENGIAWDINYRGELLFLQQARAQPAERQLLVADGWEYFLLGWLLVVMHVLDVDFDAATLARLAQQAEELR